MATREEVYSLFGIKSPAQIMAERRQEAQAMLGKLDGAGQAGFGVGMGLQRLFGVKPQGLEQSEQFSQAMQGVDISNPDQLRELAKTVSSFAPEAALRMLTEAKTLETPKYAPVDVQVMEPEFDALGRKVGESPKSIKRTGVFVGGKLTGYIDGQTGETIPLASTSSVGVMDTPEAKASRQQDPNKKDLGGGVSLTMTGKTPLSQEELDAARSGTQTTTPATPATPDDGGTVLPTDKFPVESTQPADIRRGVTTEAQSDTALPATQRPQFETTPLETRDEGMGQLQQKDTRELLGMLKALENQLTLSFKDQELLRMITAELSDRRQAPQQQQR